MDVEDGAQAALVKALEEANVTAVCDPGLIAVKKGAENNSPGRIFALHFRLFLFHTRFYSLPKELLAFASLVSISLSILASDEMVQPRWVNC